MLVGLSIRDIVLIDRLDLDFGPGLHALTGETGAGKSILLDSLGLALGARADSGLVRHGADSGDVAATFDLAPDHPAHGILREAGVDDDGESTLILRRTLAADGGSRAYVNDRPATVALLRRLGAGLVEIQGQFEQRGLVDPATHRALLDGFGRLDGLAAPVAAAWDAWRAAAEAERTAAEDQARAEADEAYLRHAVEELAALDPGPDEEARLAETRSALMNRERIVEAVNAALAETGGDGDVERRLRAALAAVERAAPKAAGRLDAARDALDRALAECVEATAQLEAAGRDVDLDAAELETIEERLFALREVARKHRVEVSALATLRADLERRLALVEDRDDALRRLARATAAARAGYVKAAEALSAARHEAAARLDKAVMAELPPLRLGKAVFRTAIEARAEDEWGRSGRDRVAFEIATNPGTPPGPLGRVASGGELSRLMLALRVVLSETGSAPSLVFDEVDSGIGGATAAAVGERLARLAARFQVLVVTHSPQVAARGARHLRVEKAEEKGAARTRVVALAAGERREEIARMLAGHRVTDEARAAADSLLAGDAA